VKKIAKFLGNVLAVLGLYFVIQRILNSGATFGLLFSFKNGVLLLSLSTLLGLMVVANSIAWKELLYVISGKMISLRQIYAIYAQSSIAKYVPGNMMHFVSRNTLGVDLGISQGSIAVSSVFEVLLKIAAAVLLAGTLFFLSPQSYLKLFSLSRFDLSPTAIISLLFFFAVLGIVLSGLILNKKNWPSNTGQVLLVVLIYLAVFGANVLGFFGSLSMSSIDLAWSDLLVAGGVYILSWLLGYITPGAPGGLGVREALLLLGLESIIRPDQLAIVLIVSRLLTILGDVLGFIFSKLPLRFNKVA
jgi:uncharacterized membrane protein YbhN (UPF0104 family)